MGCHYFREEVDLEVADHEEADLEEVGLAAAGASEALEFLWTHVD